MTYWEKNLKQNVREYYAWGLILSDAFEKFYVEIGKNNKLNESWFEFNFFSRSCAFHALSSFPCISENSRTWKTLTLQLYKFSSNFHGKSFRKFENRRFSRIKWDFPKAIFQVRATWFLMLMDAHRQGKSWGRLSKEFANAWNFLYPSYCSFLLRWSFPSAISSQRNVSTSKTFINFSLWNE